MKSDYVVYMIDFGLVTVSLSDRKALELYKEDIPQGQMIDYIMASASFPGFKLQPIEGKYYLDGGFYDNCPISLLIKKGYTEIIAVRTLGEPLKRKYQPEGVHVIEILPAEPLGNTLIFDNNIIRNNLKMGYFDGLRVIRQLTGQKYYLTDTWHKQASI